jgi:c(7)-type cytochrome triheme protein
VRAAIVIAVLALAHAAHADPDPDAPPTFDAAAQRAVGFDHRIHDRNLIVAGKEALACARCHALARGRLVGRPGHAACFGACHGAPPRATGAPAVPAEQVRVCSACHAGAQLAARAAGTPVTLAVPYPPYEIDRDFGLAMSHAKHAAATCETCHARIASGAKAKPAPHERCLGCHAPDEARRGAPPMSACAACHPDAYGPAAGPRMVEGPLALTGFDHAKHRGRAAAPCTSCHAAIASADGPALATPTAATCAAGACHDGVRAFPIIASCARCHTRAPTQTWHPPRPTTRFSHAAHAPRMGDVDCATCHALDRRGEATPPGHAACAGCHADDFGAAAPRICGACHIATEPWRKLIADREPPLETEFGGRLSHALHDGACEGCHATPSSERELRPPRGHATCAACHQRIVAPLLDDCTACHAAGAAAARTRDRLGAPWSVRARFRHAAHAKAACTDCHADITTARTIADVPAPPKRACAPCHDGATAFKLTGTGCARCHGKSS